MKQRYGKMIIVLISLFLFIMLLSACGSSSSTTSSEQSAANTSPKETSSTAPNPNESETNKQQEASSAKPEEMEGLPALPSFIKEKGKLVIGVKVDYPPFGFLDEKGENDGFEIDFAKKLAEYAFGDPNAIEYVGVTGSNRIPYLNTNKIDVILATMGVTEERAKEVDFTKEYFKSGVMLLVPKDSDIEKVEDLAGENVIVIKGTTGSMGLEELVPSAEQLKLDNTSEALRALKAERGVSFAQDDILLFDIAKNNPEFKVVGSPFNVTAWSMAVRKGEQEWLDWLDAATKKTQEEDLFYEWFNKWLPANEIPIGPEQFILRPTK